MRYWGLGHFSCNFYHVDQRWSLNIEFELYIYGTQKTQNCLALWKSIKQSMSNIYESRIEAMCHSRLKFLLMQTPTRVQVTGSLGSNDNKPRPYSYTLRLGIQMFKIRMNLIPVFCKCNRCWISWRWMIRFKLSISSCSQEALRAVHEWQLTLLETKKNGKKKSTYATKWDQVTDQYWSQEC